MWNQLYCVKYRKRDIRVQGHAEKIKMLSEEASEIWKVLSEHLDSREKVQHTSGWAKDLGEPEGM